jgi:hypothetical protein
MLNLEQQNKVGNFSYHSNNNFCFSGGVLICCQKNLPATQKQIDLLWQQKTGAE